MNEDGIVYVLTNPAMPDIVKIGMTIQDEVELRMAQLYTTGVPVPFDCSFAGRVNDVKKVEKAIHKAFSPYRLNPKREFFEIEDSQAIALLELVCIEDVTPQINNELDKVDSASKNAGDALAKKRRPRFNFREMGIEKGSVLESNFNDEHCIVLNERDVKFRDEKMSLTQATRIKLENDYNVAPGPYWRFEGQVIRDLYNETYSH
ncbi:MAG: GIY-YIG nuclease family protein [Bacteroidota bacterium]